MNCHCVRPILHAMSMHPSVMTNTICNSCGTHWYGNTGDVKQYTRKEWDDLMNSVFDAVRQIEMFA